VDQANRLADADQAEAAILSNWRRTTAGLFERQEPAKQAGLLKTLPAKRTFDRGTRCPSYTSPFDLFVEGNETGDWLAVRDGFRTWVMANAA
jgi:hypothetical protein